MKLEKLLILTGQLGIGGAERELVTFLRGLRNVGSRLKIKVASLTPGGEFKGEIEALSSSDVASPVTKHRLGKLLWLRRLIAKEQPDLVHSWNIYPMFYLKCGFFRPRFPILGFLQGIPEQSFREDRYPWLFRFLVKAPDGLVSNSAAALRELTEMGVDFGRSVVVQNGVDEQFFSARACDEAVARRQNPPVMAAVGRLIPRKRTDWMIRAIRELHDQGFEATLWVIGDGPERGPLEKLAGELGMGQAIKFWGTRNDVECILPGADIFLHCAWAEGLPNSVQEAMASGLPVVAARTSGIPEIIDDGHEGRLYQVNDYDGCYKALIELVTNRDLRMEMAKCARARAERDFKPEIMVANLLEFYGDVMDGWDAVRRR